jgi:nucleotide-binding universal stress UspA family protein
VNQQIRRILCATDLNNNNAELYRYALKRACEDDARILVFHVIIHRSIEIAKIIAYLFNEVKEDRLKANVEVASQQMKKQLVRFYKHEIKNHPEYADRVERVIVHHGDAAEEIAEKADRFGCQTIVMGSQGPGLLKRIFPGSTAKKVRKRTKIPVHTITLTRG